MFKDFNPNQKRDSKGQWVKGIATEFLKNQLRERVSGALQEAAQNKYGRYKKYIARSTRPSRFFKKSEQARKLEDAARKVGSLSNPLVNTGYAASGINRASRISRTIDRMLGRLEGAFKSFNPLQMRWPSGTPKGGQWKDDGTAQFNEAMSAIEKSVGKNIKQPTLDTSGNFPRVMNAAYNFKTGVVFARKKSTPFEMTHEIGHYTADKIFSDYKAQGKLKKVSAAIDSTPYSKAWNESKLGTVVWGNKRITVSPTFASYFNRPEEKFARAFAQYVALKSNNPKLLKELRKNQSGILPYQWSDKEFESIYNALDEVLK